MSGEEAIFALLWLVTIVAVWFFKEWYDRTVQERNKEHPKHKCPKCGLLHREDEYRY